MSPPSSSKPPAAASSTPGASKSASPGPSLTCIQVLRPPKKTLTIMDDDNDNSSNNIVLEYSLHSPAWQVAFTQDGTYLAACYGAPDPCVRIYKCNNTTQGRRYEFYTSLAGIQERTIRSLAFAPTLPDRPVLATASFDGSVCIWEQAAALDDHDKNNNASTTPTATPPVWDCTAQLEGHDNECKCVCWNATCTLLATCGRDKTIWLWECSLPGSVGGGEDAEFECLAVLNGHEGDVKSIVFAPSHGQWGDGDEILLSASYDDTIRCWAEDDGDWYCATVLDKAHTSTIWSLSVAPSGARLVSASDDGSIAIYKAYTLQEKRQLFPDEKGTNGLWKCVGKLPNAHASTIFSIACAPAKAGHGRMASASADNCIQIYREALGSLSDQPKFSLDAVAALKQDVHCICWHPWDGSILASASDDGAIRIWKYKTM